MEKIILFGLGDLASLAHQFFTYDSPHEVVAFTVDREYMNTSEFFGLPVVPYEEVESIYSPQEYKLFVFASFRSMNSFREKKYLQGKSKGYQFVNYISSKAMIWPNLVIGENCCIMQANMLDPFVEIGNDVVLWSGNHIGHHTVIKDHCFITSMVSIGGRSTVEPYCFLGMNSTIRDQTTVATRTLVGAGVTLLRDTKEGEVFRAPRAEALKVPSSRLRISHKSSS